MRQRPTQQKIEKERDQDHQQERLLRSLRSGCCRPL
jgi:hypothetical protein